VNKQVKIITYFCESINTLFKDEFELLQSHHRPREGPFELNDVFAIINAVPAIALLSYGFLNKGLVPGLCFGAVSISLRIYFFISKSLN